MQATELLLQERIPVGVRRAHPRAEEVLTGRVSSARLMLTRVVYDSPHLPTPRTQLLSNGTYNVMITTAGSGYYCEACGEAVTRWREDVTRDNWGSVYLPARRAQRRGLVGRSSTGQRARRSRYEVAFSEDKADSAHRCGHRDAHGNRRVPRKTTPKCVAFRSQTTRRARAKLS